MTPARRQPSHAPEPRAAARSSGRRRFLTTTGAAAALAFSVNLPAAGAASAAELDAARLPGDPFTLGVASGDPLPGSVLLRTRLAPAHRRVLRDGGGGAGAQAGVTSAAPEPCRGPVPSALPSAGPAASPAGDVPSARDAPSLPVSPG